MKKLLWRFFKSYVLNEQFKPIGFDKLELAFVNEDKKKYYRFPDAMALPLERNSKLTEFIYLYSMGVSSESFDKLLDIIDENLQNGLTDKKVKSASKIGAIVQQMRWRKGMCVPVELLYNILALQLVREDEKPEVYDNELQMKKVIDLKGLVENYGCGFFLGWKELKMLFDFTTKSESEWREFWMDCQIETQVMMETNKLFSSTKASKESESVTMNS